MAIERPDSDGVDSPSRVSNRASIAIVSACLAIGLAVLWGVTAPRSADTKSSPQSSEPPRPRLPLNDSGFALVRQLLPKWKDPTSLTEIRDAFKDIGHRNIKLIEQRLETPDLEPLVRLDAHISIALLFLYEGEPRSAYDHLSRARAIAAEPALDREWLSTILFLQGVAALRRGETENCVECRGEGSCVFPILPSAIHRKPEGSRLAARHFTEYLRRHPSDMGVRWLLNVAAMTLGEHPQGLPPEFRLESFVQEPEHAFGKFRDVAHLVGVNRFNQAGGAIMEDFDNDGWLDLAITSMDPAAPLAIYRNKGDGTFEERIDKAKVQDQLGGLYCVQTDYNNDGFMDIFVIRGAWFDVPMRPSLLRNNGDMTFTDVTREAGLMDPVNSICASWADYDNDGHLDLFIGCDHGPNRLYRNKGNGTFEEVARQAGVAGPLKMCKGASWGDFDNDGFPDLVLNYLDGPPQLFRNNRNGTFTDVAAEMGITRPTVGFSCWFWDYDNDGWLDVYLTSYERTLDDIVLGMLGREHQLQSGRLYRNVEGKRFEDVTRQAGLDRVMAPMGSNYADFDNDGYLDFYLATGEPPLSTLVPNFLFRNLGGKRFADITIPSRVGHLQKGHAVACGDWDRDGNIDMFVEIGGAIPGDRFHNALFQNPGNHGNAWLNLKLVGAKSNRAAIGARIKVTTDRGETFYRHVNSGSSFGGNPLEQHIGLGKARKIETLAIRWPTNSNESEWRKLDVQQAIEINESSEAIRRRRYDRIAALPQ